MSTENLSGHDHPEPNSIQQDDFPGRLQFYGLQFGIQSLAANGVVVVKDTVLRDNNTAFDAQGAQDVTLDGARISNNFFGVTLDDGARVRVTNSVLASNASVALYVNSHFSALSVLTVAHSIITGSPAATGIQVLATIGTAEAFVIANAFDIGTGIQFTPVGGTVTVYSSGDNRMVIYASPVSGGSLTPLGAF